VGREQLHGYPCHGFHSGRVEKQYADNQIDKMLLSDQGRDLLPEGGFGRAEEQINLIRQAASDEVDLAQLTWRTPAPLA
jgi:hypothetical protein